MRALVVVVVSLVGLVAAPAAWAAGISVAGSVTDSSTLAGATSVAAVGGYAYTTGYYAGELSAIDYSNPAAPVIAGSSAPSNAVLNASTVNVAGGFAFVASKNRNATNGTGSNDDGTGNSLTIFDISTNPAVPRIVGTVTDATKLFGAYGVAVSGNYAYVAAQGCLSGQPCPNTSVGNSFEVIDISNPAGPKIVATLHNSSLKAPWTGTNALDHVCSVAISGHYAYVTAAYSNRLTVIDISNPLSPTIVGSDLDNTNLKFPVDVAVQGNYAYVADQSSGVGELAVVDVSNPSAPKVVGSLVNKTALNGAYRVRVRGNFAYVSAVYAATVSAIDVSNPPSPRLAASVTSAPDLNRTTGLDLDPGSRYAIASSPYLSTQTQPIYPPFPPATGAPTMTGTISLIPLDPAPIGVSITSEPADPTTQPSATFAFATTDAVSSVLCSIDGAPYSFCTTPASEQYAALSPGSHTFTVQATDAAGQTATATYTWTIQTASTAPANTSLPAISGTPAQGDQLTASTGTWTGTPTPTFAYQWSDCDPNGANCSAISGAKSSTYTAQSTDVGSTLEVTVTATNTAGTAQATSKPTALVTSGSGGAAPVNTSPPGVAGSAVEAQTLTASPGTWTGTPAPTYTYQWFDCDPNGANCGAISGATSSTYTAQSNDVGSTLEVAVTATNTAGAAQATSNPTALVTSAPGPVTALLDGFNLPNNSGPPDANWSLAPVVATAASNNLRIMGDQVGGISGSNGDYWNPQTFGPNSEDWITVATKPTSSNDPITLGLRFANPGLSTATGYQAYWFLPNKYQIVVRVNGKITGTLAITSSGPTLNAGDHLLFRAIGSTLELWRESGTTWTRLLTGSDSTITSPGYLLLSERNTATRLDNFGGGTLP